ncbi:TPA: hypothetical protein N0F65_000098 [Lagenidium giganteum]|uniref:Tf2-1-like SH3-like domain-containing protein n=1 Tax=Lagenidium giganteum TaxID=4803 RepID=A0AAV2YKV2_9STRA|nr:TPA: hypothetical protein N0F65_000098 [Lagenidium giganteum]
MALRKMDTKPPVFEDGINGTKLNSFIFQFEQYYKQKGYDLDVHGDLLGDKLNQSVKKAALVRYEHYMTALNTDKTWGCDEGRNRLNFQETMRQQLITINQLGTYHDYVLRFRELHRVLKIEEGTAMTLFYNGLISNVMRENIRRTKPKSIKEAMNAVFLEQDIQMPGTSVSTRRPKGTKREPTNLGNKSPHNGTIKPSKVTKTKCTFCNKGFHAEAECRAKHPDRPKRPSTRNEELDAKIYAAQMYVHENEEKLTKEKEEKQVKNEKGKGKRKRSKIEGETTKNGEGQKKAEEELETYSLLHVQSVPQYDRNDVMLSNSNFIDNGASINAVSPEFCAAHGLLRDDYDGISPAIQSPAAGHTFYVDLGGLRALFRLRKVNPAIDWIDQTVQPRSSACQGPRCQCVKSPERGSEWTTARRRKNMKPKTTTMPASGALCVGGKRVHKAAELRKPVQEKYFTHGYHSVSSGQTKYITAKLFRRMMRKKSKIECSPVYPVLKKHPRVFQAKLPKELPPIEHSEHEMDVKADEPVYPPAVAPVTRTGTPQDVAVRYRNHIIRLHGVPEEVLSDRDTKFTSQFWASLSQMFGTETEDGPSVQANGQRINQSIEHYLRVYINGAVTDWDEHLSLAEFAYNSRYQESIRMSPFEADIGYIPATPNNFIRLTLSMNAHRTREDKKAVSFLKEQADRLAALRRNLQEAQDRQKCYYDQNRPIQVFNVGDQVMLSKENVSTQHVVTTKKKLGALWTGPFEVVKRISHDYYQLNIPER